MANTYWGSKGKFQAFADHLIKLIPAEGEVPNKKVFPALEKFRKASNCYYDLYNNGLYNRAREFRHAFGFASSNYKYGFGQFSSTMYELVEAKMDRIVLDAMDEQVDYANRRVA